MKPHTYARILGSVPRTAKVNRGVIASLSEFVSVFGPPESHGTNGERILFWNFTRDPDAQQYFTAHCRVPSAVPPSGKMTVDVQAATGRGAQQFFEWFADRHLATISGEEAPFFIVGNGPVHILNRAASV